MYLKSSEEEEVGSGQERVGQSKSWTRSAGREQCALLPHGT